MRCDNPINVKLKQPIYNAVTNSHIYTVPLRCGKCLPCLQYRVNSWIFRLQYDLRDAQSAYFVTLTYDTQFVPITQKGFMTLKKQDAKYFIKALIKNAEYRTIPTAEEIKFSNKLPVLAYYGCGEYGSVGKRPHYHFIIYNASKTDIINSWPKGSIDIQEVGIGAIKYVLKYIEKKQAKLFAAFDGEMEFSIYSKGIGRNYINEPGVKDYFKYNLGNNYLYKDGYKIPMPKYYRRNILTDKEMKKQIVIIKNQIDEAENKEMQRMLSQGVNYDHYKNMGVEMRYYKLKNIPNRLDI